MIRKLAQAVSTENQNGLQELLASCTADDVNGLGEKGLSVLHLAAQKGFTAGLVMILNFPGVNVDQFTKSQDTALHLAAKQGQDAAVMLLLASGANFTLKDSSGQIAEAIAKGRASESFTQWASQPRLVLMLKWPVLGNLISTPIFSTTYGENTITAPYHPNSLVLAHLNQQCDETFKLKLENCIIKDKLGAPIFIDSKTQMADIQGRALFLFPLKKKNPERIKVEDFFSAPDKRDLLFQYSEECHILESIEFLEAIFSFKQEMTARANAIYEKFIKDGSPDQINVPNIQLLTLKELIKNQSISVNMFDEVQKDVKVMIERDHLFTQFPKWEIENISTTIKKKILDSTQSPKKKVTKRPSGSDPNTPKFKKGRHTKTLNPNGPHIAVDQSEVSMSATIGEKSKQEKDKPSYTSPFRNSDFTSSRNERDKKSPDSGLKVKPVLNTKGSQDDLQVGMKSNGYEDLQIDDRRGRRASSAGEASISSPTTKPTVTPPSPVPEEISETGKGSSRKRLGKTLTTSGANSEPGSPTLAKKNPKGKKPNTSSEGDRLSVQLENPNKKPTQS